MRIVPSRPRQGGLDMITTMLIAGPPGCGKTSWILNRLQSHPGPCGYLRLPGFPEEDLPQAHDGGIDLTYLQYLCPGLLDLSQSDLTVQSQQGPPLALIELPQFQPPHQVGLEGLDPRLIPYLDALHLIPDQYLHFGRDSELPVQDTLDFHNLETWSHNLTGSVWDPDSLNSFWFELVNGAYGDVYRAKALMNRPDGGAFFFNWMVSRSGSQFLPLQTMAPPDGRPERLSHLVLQGRGLNPAGIETTISDCLLSDAVLELQQSPLRPSQHPAPLPI